MTRRMIDAEFLDALDDLVIEGILAMSGDELRAEILAKGGDPDAMGAEARACLDRALRETEAARAAWKSKPSHCRARAGRSTVSRRGRRA